MIVGYLTRVVIALTCLGLICFSQALSKGYYTSPWLPARISGPVINSCKNTVSDAFRRLLEYTPKETYTYSAERLTDFIASLPDGILRLHFMTSPCRPDAFLIYYKVLDVNDGLVINLPGEDIQKIVLWSKGGKVHFKAIDSRKRMLEKVLPGVPIYLSTAYPARWKGGSWEFRGSEITIWYPKDKDHTKIIDFERAWLADEVTVGRSGPVISTVAYPL